MSLSLALARHVVNLEYDDLPAAVVDTTRLCILDTIGVSLAACSLGEAATAFADLAQASAAGACTVIGHGIRRSADLAAFVNGSTAHALDYEDTHDGGLVHPTGTALYAALAAAEERGGVNGAQLLTAVAAGADLTCRLALALADETRHGWSIRPLLGAYGAAAAAGKIYGLTAEQMVQAFALAFCQATSSTGFMGYSRSHWREMRDAFAARAGVISAQLALRGIQCYDQPFEGAHGLYAQYAQEQCDQDRILRDLGRVFEGANVSFKPWPSCRGTHAFVEAALRLVGDDGVHVQDIARVEARVSPVFRVLTEPIAQKRRPATANDAKFSLPYTIAVALVRRRVDLSAYLPEALTDSAVLAMAEKVECVVDDTLEFADSLQGTLTVHLVGRQQLTHTVRTPLGHPLRPIEPRQLEQKFLECASFAPPETAAHHGRWLQRLKTIDALDDVRNLFD